MKLYCTYDIVAKLYTLPVGMVNDQVAKRQFTLACTSGNTAAVHTDLELYCVGNFNDETGMIEPCHDLVLSGKQIEVTK